MLITEAKELSNPNIIRMPASVNGSRSQHFNPYYLQNNAPASLPPTNLNYNNFTNIYGGSGGGGNNKQKDYIAENNGHVRNKVLLKQVLHTT